MFGELVCCTIGAFGLTHFSCEFRRLCGMWACQTDLLEVLVFIMNAEFPVSLLHLVLPLWIFICLLSLTFTHADIFLFAFHLYHGQSPGSVNMPANTMCSGTLEAGGALRDVALKKKGDKFEQSMDSSFSMLGFLPLCLMDPAKNLQKTEEKLGLLPLPEFL